MSENFGGLIICPLNSKCGNYFTHHELKQLLGQDHFNAFDQRSLELGLHFYLLKQLNPLYN
jgi:hypothetical protein